jgi:hypothetical protein
MVTRRERPLILEMTPTQHFILSNVQFLSLNLLDSLPIALIYDCGLKRILSFFDTHLPEQQKYATFFISFANIAVASVSLFMGPPNADKVRFVTEESQLLSHNIIIQIVCLFIFGWKHRQWHFEATATTPLHTSHLRCR